MPYKCTNKKCKNLNKVVNPGGRVIIIEGVTHDSGSMCTICNKTMEKVPSKMPTIHNIKNPSDGRNLQDYSDR